MNEAEKLLVRATKLSMALIGLLAATMLLWPSSMIKIADLAAVVASWSAIAIAGMLVILTAKQLVKIELVIAIAVLVGSYLYLDHIYHELQLEENVKAAASALQK